MIGRNTNGDLPSSLEMQDSEAIGIQQLNIQKIRRGILRHILLILSVATIFAGFGAFLTYRLSNYYEAQAVLIYQKEVSKPSAADYEVLHLTFQSSVEMITLPKQLRAVKSILGLDMSIEELQNMITIDLPMRDSNLINITVSSENPDLATDVANTIANIAVKNARDLSRKQWQSAYAYFKERQEDVRNEIEHQIKEIGAFRKQHRFIGMDVTSLSPLATLRGVEEGLQDAHLDYKQKLVEYENLKREFSKIPDHIESTRREDSFQSHVAKVELDLLDAKSRYTPENPKIKALEYQLAELRRMAFEEAQSGEADKYYDINPLKEKLNIDLMNMQAKLRASLMLKEEMEDIVTLSEDQVASLTEEQLSFADLINRKESLELDLKSNDAMQYSLDILMNLGMSDLEIYQPAEEARPREDSLLIDLLATIGFLLGALFGLTIAVILEISDRNIRTAKQIEIAYEFPCFATIPELHQFQQKDKKNHILRYVRTIADRISLTTSSFKSMVITSSLENEGKSLLAYELAKYYQSLKKNVVLIEFDDHSSDSFDTHEQSSKKIENYLRGEASIEELIYHGAIDRITTGTEPNMKELLKNGSIQHLLQYLNDNYDLVMIDAPGLIEKEYAIDVIRFAEYCLFVVGSDIVQRNYIDASTEQMTVYGIKPMGVILNRVQPIYVDDLHSKTHERGNKKRKFSRVFESLKELYSANDE